jgi:pimeloyl-ACP methyl ester carboxylesterase
METTTSADGTSIAYQRSGSGPALVLVVGAFCDRGSTAGLAPLLAADYTVIEYDRRGRGSSGDAGEYAIEREVEDLAALIAAAGGSAAAYGHSSGGCLALEAAAAGLPITGLAVYEPPYTADAEGDGGSEELLRRVRERVTAGDLDGAAVQFLSASGMPAQVLDGIRQSPGWPRMRELAPALVYDLALTSGGVVPGERLAHVPVPTLAVSGGASPEWAPRACAGIAGVVRGARHETLPGQNHAVAHEAVAPLLLDWFGR